MPTFKGNYCSKSFDSGMISLYILREQ